MGLRDVGVMERGLIELFGGRGKIQGRLQLEYY